MTQEASSCPRCRSAAAKVLSRSPVAGVWTVFGCSTCLYTWRSTEPEANRDPDKYPAVFRLDPSILPRLAIVPSIPPLKAPAAGPARGTKS